MSEKSPDGESGRQQLPEAAAEAGETFKSVEHLRSLGAFLFAMLSAEIQNTDPAACGRRGGTVADTVRFLQMDLSTLTVSPGKNADYRISCWAHGNCGAGRIDGSAVLYAGPLEERTYYDIYADIREGLAGHTIDAMTYLAKNDLIPDGIHIMPSDAEMRDAIQNDTHFASRKHESTMPDPRVFSAGYVHECAEKISGQLLKFTGMTKVDRIFLDLDAENPWKVNVFFQTRNFVRRFLHLISESASSVSGDIRVVGPKAGISQDFIHRGAQDMHIAVDPQMLDFHEGSIEQVRARIEELASAWEELIVRVTSLRQSGEGFSTNGGLAMLHDPRECDGATAQFYYRRMRPALS